MDLDLQDNIEAVRRDLSDAARRQLPFAVAQAINRTLADVKRNAEKRLRRKLDRPTPFTMRVFALRRASKRRQAGELRAKPIQWGYLRRLEEGGTRRPSGKALAVPVNVRLNKYGNVPRGGVGRALARGRVFSGRPRGWRDAPAGVWQRMGRGGRDRLRLLFSYETRAEYEQRLDIRASAEKTARARFAKHFTDTFREAMGTRRG